MRKWVVSEEPPLENCNSFLLLLTMLSAQRALAQLLPRLVVGLVFSLLGAETLWSEEAKRPFYEYPGDYRQQINQQKDDFKARFGYELLDLEMGWKSDEIEELTLAFSRLPETFLHIPGIKGFYHFSKLRAAPEGMPVDDIPAATFPGFQTVYRNSHLSYDVEVDDQEPRIEFFNVLFYEDREVLQLSLIHISEPTRPY